MNSRPHRDNWDSRIQELASVFETEGITTFLDPETFLELIDYYTADEQYEKAISVAGLASSHYRFSTDFYVRQAQLLITINRYAEAMELLEMALAIAPGDFELNLLQAETYIRTGQHTKGLANLAPFKLQASQEDLSEILLIESLAYERDSDYEHMFYALKTALEANGDNARALDRLSLCMEFCRKHEEGIVLYQYLLDQNPYAFLVWYYLGQAYAYLGCNDDALEAYEYAFLAEANFEEAYQEFIDLCIETEHYREALSALQDLGGRFGVDSEVLLRTGTCFHALEQHETARTYLEQAARIEPHNEEIYYLIGSCYAAQEKWSKAVAFYRKAVRMSPDTELFHQALAISAFETGDYTRAEKAYRNALELSPDNPQSWLDLAWFLLEMLRKDEALFLLDEAIEGLTDAELSFGHCACLFANGRRQEGLRQLAFLLEDHYDGYNWLIEWQPLLRSDREVKALMSLYRPD